MAGAGDDLVPCCASLIPVSAGVAAIPETLSFDLESVRCPAETPAAAVRRAFAHLPSHVDSSPCRSARQSAGQHYDAGALFEAERLPHAPAAHHHPQPALSLLLMHLMSHFLTLSHPAGQMAAAAAAACGLLNGVVAADAVAGQAGHLARYTAVAQ